MPIYEYMCAGCQTKFELLRSFSRADEPAACPQCQSQDSRRLISAFASFSKGEGGVTTAIGGSSCGRGSCGGCSGCGQ